MTSIHPAVRVGHIHLSVADLDRSIAFYRDGLGFNLIADGRQLGSTPRSWRPATTTTTSG